MRAKIKLVDEAGRQAVKAAMINESDQELKVRLQAVRLAYTGQHTLSQIAELVDRARSSAAEYIRLFRKGGVEALRPKARGGKRARSTKIDQETTEALLAGLLEGRWKRAKEIHAWLEKRKGPEMTLSGIYSWLRRKEAKPKVPRKSHGKQDPAKTEAFKANLYQKLTDLGVAPGRKVRLWVVDEHRYGLISVLRKVWSLKGCRPTAPYHTKYKWGYLYSALEVGGEGRSEAFFSPSVSLDWSRAFLLQIAASDPSSEHVIIWDQAGFHQTDKTENLPERIFILPLPPYSPELNPVEKIGDFIKDRIANTLWHDLLDIEAAIEEELRPIWHSPQRVISLIGDGWLLQQANDIFLIISPK